MHSPKSAKSWRRLALLTPLLLAACASGLPQQPVLVVGKGIQLTPPPASVTEIDLKSSDGWREKVKNYLSKLEAFLANETPK